MTVERFVNELMTSNCYIVADDDSKTCIVIDPGSEKSEREIAYISGHQLIPTYIIITHEHTDHNWGVNSLREKYPNVKLVCSELCSKYVAVANKAYFLFYYDDPDYSYEIDPANIIIKGDEDSLECCGRRIEFIMAPGHSFGSMCVKIGDILFTGDTIMPYPPYFNGRDSNRDDWEMSIDKILADVPVETIVYPGHGDKLTLKDWLENNYVSQVK